MSKPTKVTCPTRASTLLDTLKWLRRTSRDDGNSAQALIEAQALIAERDRLETENAILREALERSLPWLCKAAAEDIHLPCVAPSDLERAIAFAQRSLPTSKVT